MTYQLPEAEIIPLGTTALEKKKLSTVTKRYSNIFEYENNPLPGFFLFNSGKNYHYGGSSWQIVDPRGFIVKVSSSNLEQLIHRCNFSNGLIQEKCVWARNDSQTRMFLLPAVGETYNTISENTFLMQNRISIKDVNIGDTVFLQSGLAGIYFGSMNLYGTMQNSTYMNYKPQVFNRKHVIQVANRKYFYTQDPKILKITNKIANPLTPAQAVDIVNGEIKKGNVSFFNYPQAMNSTYSSSRGVIKYVSLDSVKKVMFSLKEIDLVEASDLFFDGAMHYDFGLLVLQNDKKEMFLIDHPYTKYYNLPNSINAFKICKIAPIKTKFNDSIMLLEKRMTWDAMKNGLYGLNDFAKYYAIVKHVKGNTYI